MEPLRPLPFMQPKDDNGVLFQIEGGKIKCRELAQIKMQGRYVGKDVIADRLDDVDDPNGLVLRDLAAVLEFVNPTVAIKDDLPMPTEEF